MLSYLILFILLSSLNFISASISPSCVHSASLPWTMAERIRSGKGRQKIENKTACQVTFSKRQAGLCKNVNELCTLCGVEVAILVSTPSGNILSFGHPSVECTLNRYLNGDTPQEEIVRLVDAYRGANVRNLNRRYTDLLAQFEYEKEEAKKLKATVDANDDGNGKSLWEVHMEKLNLTDLEQLKLDLSALKNNITKEIDRMETQVSFPSPVLAINSVDGVIDRSIPSESTMNNLNDAGVGAHGFGLGIQNGLGSGPF